MYQNDPLKVLTGEVRMSYVHLIEPRTSKPGDDPKYSVTLLIPKTDFATKADIDASIQAAFQDAVSKVWNGAAPPQLRVPIYDGDGVRPSGEPFGEECRGHWVMAASTFNRPQVVGVQNINQELPPREVYSGMYARVTIRFFGYSNSGNKGIGCGLGNVMKTRDFGLWAANTSSTHTSARGLSSIMGKVGLHSFTTTISSLGSYRYLNFGVISHVGAGKLKIRAAKLELGSVQTLAHKEGDTWVLNDPPSNYALELAKCQRYFYREINNSSANLLLGTGVPTGSASMTTAFRLPAPMRAKPDITLSDPSHILYTKGSFGSINAAAGASRNGVIGTDLVGINITGSYDLGSPYNILLAANGYIDFSAEL